MLRQAQHDQTLKLARWLNRFGKRFSRLMIVGLARKNRLIALGMVRVARVAALRIGDGKRVFFLGVFEANQPHFPRAFRLWLFEVRLGKRANRLVKQDPFAVAFRALVNARQQLRGLFGRQLFHAKRLQLRKCEVAFGLHIST